MTTHRLSQANVANGTLDGLLNDKFVNVTPPACVAFPFYPFTLYA